MSCEGFSSGYTEMISCSRDVMTPARKLACALAAPDADSIRTERMPENKSKLRYLLSFLAELQQRRLAGRAVQRLGDPVQNPPVLFSHAVAVAHDAPASTVIAKWSSSARAIAAAILTIATIMLLLLLLLLSYRIGGGCCLRLCGVLMLVLMLLSSMVVPVRLVIGALLLMGEDVLHGGCRRR